MTALATPWLVVVLCLALAGSFICSGSETGVISANAARVRHFVAQRRFGARILERLLEHREQTIVAVLIGNNLALVTATVAFVTLLTRLFMTIDPGGVHAVRWAQTATPLLLTPIILFGCEILPKSIFRARPIRTTRIVAPLIEAFRVCCTPVSFLLMHTTRAAVRAIGGEETERPPLITREELLRVFAQGEAGGALEEDEHDMIQGIIDFGLRTAAEVMVPRTHVAMVRDSATCGELYEIVGAKGHSRIPVYQNRVDNVVGVVYVRDLLGGMYEDSADVTPLIRPIMYVPESMRADDLLREMRLKQRSVAIVVDEHGGMAGMLTLEDLLEEIVGEIRDEHDLDEAPTFGRLPDGSYLVAASMTLAEANSELHLGIPDPGVVETIGGYLVHLQGRIPAQGELVRVGDLQFAVVAATDRAVQRVRIRRVPGTPESPA